MKRLDEIDALAEDVRKGYVTRQRFRELAFDETPEEAARKIAEVDAEQQEPEA